MRMDKISPEDAELDILCQRLSSSKMVLDLFSIVILTMCVGAAIGVAIFGRTSALLYSLPAAIYAGICFFRLLVGVLNGNH